MGEAGLVREDKADGTQEWIDEYGRVRGEGKMALLLGRNVNKKWAIGWMNVLWRK